MSGARRTKRFRGRAAPVSQVTHSFAVGLPLKRVPPHAGCGVKVGVQPRCGSHDVLHARPVVGHSLRVHPDRGALTIVGAMLGPDTRDVDIR